MTETVRSHYTITINDCLWKVHLIQIKFIHQMSPALWPCIVVWVHTNILEEQAASTFRVEVSHTWIKINYAWKMAYVNQGQAGMAFKQGPENTVFKEDPCNGHRVKRNKPNEVHAFSIYSLLWFFQGATERNLWPVQVKITFLFRIVGRQHEVCFPGDSIHESPWRQREYIPVKCW